LLFVVSFNTGIIAFLTNICNPKSWDWDANNPVIWDWRKQQGSRDSGSQSLIMRPNRKTDTRHNGS